MNKFIKTLAAPALAIVCAFGMAAPAAFAEDGTTAVVNAGTLTITNSEAGDFAVRTITGADQQTTASLGIFSVSDFTGSGAGWHVTAQASTFTGLVFPHVLLPGSLSMSEPDVAADDTASPEPSIVAGPYTIDNGAVQIASADNDEGMGKYDFTATTLTLTLPANVFADSYTSMITIDVVTAP